MSTQELVLNIAVNLGRIGRYAYEGREPRVDQFLSETSQFVRQLESMKVDKRFEETLTLFKESFVDLQRNKSLDASWAETAYTWANILTHRAKLAG